MSDRQNFTYEQLCEALRESQKYGFLSPQLIERQIQHSLEFIDLCPQEDGTVVDLGAGGGLPSLVWLHHKSDSTLRALDAMKKRTDFLQSLRLRFPHIASRFEVMNGRAEILAREDTLREKHSRVVARGFGPPAITAECASGYLKVGGILVVSGRPEDEILRWNKAGLAKVGLSFVEVRSSANAHAAIMEKTEPIDSTYPRRGAVLKKSPLWI